jgi:hypothetical protein
MPGFDTLRIVAGQEENRTAQEGRSFCFKRAAPRLAEIVLRAVNCSKGGAGIFRQGSSEKSSGPPLRGLLTNPHHSAILLCRDGTRNGLFRSEQGTGSFREGRGGSGKSEARLPAVCRMARPPERGLAGGAKGSSAASFHRYSQCRYSFYRLRRGALAACRTSAPSGGVRRIRGVFLPA